MSYWATDAPASDPPGGTLGPVVDAGRALDDESASDREPDHEIAQTVGANLRRFRARQQLTLDALARRSGVSRAMLGQIELGRSTPSIAIVWKIARALDISVTSFLGEALVERDVLIRAADSAVVVAARGKVRVRALFREAATPRTEFFELRFAPLVRHRSSAREAGARANLVVAQGSIELGVGDRKHTLATGDSVQFSADVEHVYRNLVDGETLAYLVLSFPRSES
ncbi:MAG TPA: XRE family transcriptional regulator [Rhodocyclaceae bacterium]|nr:XRE family transcriptional regulator [Rhodocyclaceae bacterium]